MPPIRSLGKEKMKPIWPDLYQLALPTPFPVGPVNVYVARDVGGVTLIDCGPLTPEALAGLEAGLGAVGFAIPDIRRIVVTHAHADHSGLAARLVQQSGAQVLAHPFNRAWLEAYEQEREQRLLFYAEVMRRAGVPTEIADKMNRMRRKLGDYAQPVEMSGVLNDGDTLTLAGRAWRILHTPGHSVGLICLYEPRSRLLLSSDHLLCDISSNAVIEPPPPGNRERMKSLPVYLAQLERVAALEIAMAWPGHGKPIKDVRELVRRRLEFHERRAAHILELAQDGKTIYQIAQALFGTLDPLNFFLALSEVIGHLELLEARGKIQTCQVWGRERDG